MHGEDDPERPVPAGLNDLLSQAPERYRQRYARIGYPSAIAERTGGMDPYQQISASMQTYLGERHPQGGVEALGTDSIRRSSTWTGASTGCCGCCRAAPSSIFAWHAAADDLTLCGACARYAVLDPHPALPQGLTAVLALVQIMLLLVAQPLLLYLRALQVEDAASTGGSGDDVMSWGAALMPMYLVAGIGTVHMTVSSLCYCQWTNATKLCGCLVCLVLTLLLLTVALVGSWLDHGDLVLGGALAPLVCVLSLCCLPPAMYACAGAWMAACGCCTPDWMNSEEKQDPAAVLPRYNPFIREKIRVRRQVQQEVHNRTTVLGSGPSAGRVVSRSPPIGSTATAWGSEAREDDGNVHAAGAGRRGLDDDGGSGSGSGAQSYDPSYSSGSAVNSGRAMGVSSRRQYALASTDLPTAVMPPELPRASMGHGASKHGTSAVSPVDPAASPEVRPPPIPSQGNRPRGIAARLAAAHGVQDGEELAQPPTPVGVRHTVPGSGGGDGSTSTSSQYQGRASAPAPSDGGSRYSPSHSTEDSLDAEMQNRSETAVAMPLYGRGGCCGASWEKWLLLAVVLELCLGICLLVSLAAAAGPGTDAAGSKGSSGSIRRNARIASLLFLSLMLLGFAISSSAVAIVTLRMRDSLAGPFSGLYGGQIRRVSENNKGSLELQAELDREVMTGP